MVDKEPLRVCVACRKQKPKRELLRIVRSLEGKIVVDVSGKQSGRGAYVCKEVKCLKESLRKERLAQALKIESTSVNKKELIRKIKEKAGLSIDQESNSET